MYYKEHLVSHARHTARILCAGDGNLATVHIFLISNSPQKPVIL